MHQTTYGRAVDEPTVDQAAARAQRLREELRDRLAREADQQRRAALPPLPTVSPRVAAARCLGVQAYATVQEIRAAVHRLALRHHPDRGGSAARMSEILDARDVLLGRRR